MAPAGFCSSVIALPEERKRWFQSKVCFQNVKTPLCERSSRRKRTDTLRQQLRWWRAQRTTRTHHGVVRLKPVRDRVSATLPLKKGPTPGWPRPWPRWYSPSCSSRARQDAGKENTHRQSPSVPTFGTSAATFLANTFYSAGKGRPVLFLKKK